MVLLYLRFIIFASAASLAQPVEQLIRNEQVVGSSPMRGSDLKTKNPLRVLNSEGLVF